MFAEERGTGQQRKIPSWNNIKRRSRNNGKLRSSRRSHGRIRNSHSSHRNKNTSMEDPVPQVTTDASTRPSWMEQVSLIVEEIVDPQPDADVSSKQTSNSDMNNTTNSNYEEWLVMVKQVRLKYGCSGSSNEDYFDCHTEEYNTTVGKMKSSSPSLIPVVEEEPQEDEKDVRDDDVDPDPAVDADDAATAAGCTTITEEGQQLVEHCRETIAYAVQEVIDPQPDESSNNNKNWEDDYSLLDRLVDQTVDCQTTAPAPTSPNTVVVHQPEEGSSNKEEVTMLPKDDTTTTTTTNNNDTTTNDTATTSISNTEVDDNNSNYNDNNDIQMMKKEIESLKNDIQSIKDGSISSNETSTKNNTTDHQQTTIDKKNQETTTTTDQQDTDGTSSLVTQAVASIFDDMVHEVLDPQPDPTYWK